MSVFTPELISEFVAELTTPPTDVVIMTRDEFFAWWIPSEWKPAHATRGVTPGSKFFNQAYKNSILDYLQKFAYDFGSKRSSDVCFSGGISEDYISQTFSKLLNKTPEFDSLFAVHNPFDDVDSSLDLLSIEEKINVTLEKKINKILGFFFSQKGECKDEPNNICVNLICITKNPKVTQKAIKGALLFGAAMYCIKNNPKTRKTVYLELAGSYKNAAGLHLYSSFGFIPDLSLFAGKCFSDTDNLPMSVNLKYIDNDQIVGVVNGIKYPSKNKEVREYLTADPHKQNYIRAKLIKQDMITLGTRVVQMRKRFTRRATAKQAATRVYPNINIRTLQTEYKLNDNTLGKTTLKSPRRTLTRSRTRSRRSTRLRTRV